MSLKNLLQLQALLFLISCSSHSAKTQQDDKLGTVDFSVTGKNEAQPYFKKGLLLLHSFEYEDAAEAFRKAINADKNFTMAYWGEAMTHNHSLWRYQDYKKATAVLNQLDPSPAGRVVKAATSLEKDFITGINILYGAGSKAARDSSYAAYMGKLHERYPGNDEVTAFYSIALIGSVQVGRDTKVYEEAAEMAREVLKHNPHHPGALHYLIHAYDDPQHAAAALYAADAYSTEAPAAGHALHMPTHIYLSLGMWDKVISSNIASFHASQERKERKNLTNAALGYHSFYWLMYGYLQKGEKDKAKIIADSMYRFTREINNANVREYMISQKATYLAETKEYGTPINTIEVKMDDLNIVSRAMDHYSNGMNCFYKNDSKGLDSIILKLGGEILVDEDRVTNAAGKLCGSINSAIPNQLDLQQSGIMLMELKAMNAKLKKDNLQTDKLLKQASETEAAISYAFGPPTIVKPSFELYGEWLLEMNRPEEALKQFELSLTAAPGRLLSLEGKKNAEKMMGTASLR
jgi:tetratricopeptide (TPR) repeat protein